MEQRTPERYRDPYVSPDPEAVASYARLFPHLTLPRQSKLGTRLREALLDGDALADRWIDDARSLPRAAANALVERAEREGIAALSDAPPALRALFAALERVPAWLDRARVEEGARVFRRAGPIGQLVLSELALMGGYRSQAVVKPLAMTGRLREATGERLFHTAQFVVAVARPQALLRNGEGYRAAVRVRLVHAHVRAHLRASAAYDEARWGVPINQSDMLGTNLSFSVLLVAGTRLLGLRYTRAEVDAVVHLWRYVGYLCGVSEELLPDDELGAAEALYLVAASQPGPDADSVALARALHEAPLSHAHGRVRRAVVRFDMGVRAGLNRVLLGDRVCGELGLPKAPFEPAIRALVPWIGRAEWLRQQVPILDRVASRRGGALIEAGLSAIAHVHTHPG